MVREAQGRWRVKDLRVEDAFQQGLPGLHLHGVVQLLQLLTNTFGQQAGKAWFTNGRGKKPLWLLKDQRAGDAQLLLVQRCW